MLKPRFAFNQLANVVMILSILALFGSSRAAAQSCEMPQAADGASRAMAAAGMCPMCPMARAASTPQPDGAYNCRVHQGMRGELVFESGSPASTRKIIIEAVDFKWQARTDDGQPLNALRLQVWPGDE